MLKFISKYISRLSTKNKNKPIATSKELFESLKPLIQLDERKVVSLNLKLQAGEVAKLQVESLVDFTDLESIEKLLKENKVELEMLHESCIFMEQLYDLYIDKLKREGSMDAAIKKVAWVAILKGIEIGRMYPVLTEEVKDESK